MEDTGAEHLRISKASIYDEECKVGDCCGRWCIVSIPSIPFRRITVRSVKWIDLSAR